MIESEHIDLAILDMQLPDGTGFDARAEITSGDTAIIFLTVVDDEGNIVRAFESGADDYITKPFRLRELLAKTKIASLFRCFEGSKDDRGYGGMAGTTRGCACFLLCRPLFCVAPCPQDSRAGPN